MKAHELMTKSVAICHTGDMLNIPAQLMWDHDCGAIPVVDDDGKIAGMLTDRDICMAAYTKNRPLDTLPVREAMATQVISARPEQSLAEVEQLMAEKQIRRVPVLDAAGKPLGILSMNDLAIESARSSSPLKHGMSRLVHTLAPICRPRARQQRAA